MATRRHDIGLFSKNTGALSGLAGTFDIWAGSWNGADTDLLNNIYRTIEDAGVRLYGWSATTRSYINDIVKSDSATFRTATLAKYRQGVKDLANGDTSCSYFGGHLAWLMKRVFDKYPNTTDAQALAMYANLGLQASSRQDLYNQLGYVLAKEVYAALGVMPGVQNQPPAGPADANTPQPQSFGKLAVIAGHDNINVRSTGSTSGQVLTQLFDGDIVDQLSAPNSENFVKIRTSGGTEGWASYFFLDTPQAALSPSALKTQQANISSEGSTSAVRPAGPATGFSLPQIQQQVPAGYPAGTVFAPANSGYPAGTLNIPGRGMINPVTNQPAIPQNGLIIPQKTDDTIYYVAGGLALAALAALVIWKAHSHKHEHSAE